MQRIYHLSHAPISFLFRPSSRDFVVRENALYHASGSGEHLYLFVRKKNLSTFDMIAILSRILGIKASNIGYAGLKDKWATTYQYISIPKEAEPKLSANLTNLEEHNIKILSSNAHTNKLRIGHLASNTFFVRLKKVQPLHAQKLLNALKLIDKEGLPNYFGKQRFGTNGDNYKEGEQILESYLTVRNKRISQFLRSSLQSYLFNLWLAKRIQLSKIIQSFSPQEIKHIPEFHALDLEQDMIKALKAQEHFFKLFSGDVALHYPYGRAFVCEDLAQESSRFAQRHIAPAGALSGRKLFATQGIAHKIEEPFLDSRFHESGSRRYAWIWPSGIECSYKQEEAHFDLHFTLPKSSYASVFVEALQNEPRDFLGYDSHSKQSKARKKNPD